MNSQQALSKLTAGVAKFHSEVFPQQRLLFDQLRSRQSPMALFFTCADSRIVPNLILQTGPGDIFTERTPGNIVPKYSDHVGGVTASMEFAVKALHVPLIIVCGHTDCGVMKALLTPEQASGMPALQSWMRHSQAARERLIRDDARLTQEEKLRKITEYNVLTQVDNLRSHPAVEAALAAMQLEVYGWIYDIGNGTVAAADESGVFQPLTS